MARQSLLLRYKHFTCKNFANRDLRFSRNVFTLSSAKTESFGTSHIKWICNHDTINSKHAQHYSSTSNLNNEKVFTSRLPDIPDYNGMFLHEYIWRDIEKWWDRTALECAMTGRSYTYEQLKRLSGRLATSLRKSKLRPGDTIAIILPNVIEYGILLLGASEAGLRVTLVNPLATAEEIRKQLINSETSAVITASWKYPIIQDSISNNTSIKLPVIIVEDGTGSIPSGTINFKDLISDSVEEFEKTGQKTERNPNEDTFVLPYSSGTTGPPKSVSLTHRNLVANCFQIRAESEAICPWALRTNQEIVPLFLPLFHAYGLTSILNTYLSCGGKIICIPQFSSSTLFEVLEKNKVTAIYAVPPIIQLLANDKRLTPKHVANVEFLASAAAPLSNAVAEKLIERAGTHFLFTQGYGLTETSPVVAQSLKCPLGSTGLILPQTKLRIVGCNDENKNKNLGVNEVGEIFVKGPQVMKGYYKNPQATQECMEGEWFKTGDLGLIDDQGFLYIKGRLKELIKVQGYQVAPAELEDVILGHEKVADVAVIGVPHERYGEIPKAFIVPKPNMRIDEQELKEFVAKRVAKYKHLGHITITDTIPKSPAGKILRRELLKM
ncbi:4-coumarate--CoA ligase 1-like [Chelonus insularis]|uniref:4-coumarate--CoA ligase 1-like n=1 Tax=Chelonus insularis TaxID=460826 RepID=UPI00158BBF28|nr:4-coumarate--CoA ligase 1-like [Chelonus insularis]